MLIQKQPAQTCDTVPPQSPRHSLAPETLLANQIAVDALLNGTETWSLNEISSWSCFREMSGASLWGALKALESQGFLKCIRHRRRILVIPDGNILNLYLQRLAKHLVHPTTLSTKGGLQ